MNGISSLGWCLLIVFPSWCSLWHHTDVIVTLQHVHNILQVRYFPSFIAYPLIMLYRPKRVTILHLIFASSIYILSDGVIIHIHFCKQTDPMYTFYVFTISRQKSYFSYELHLIQLERHHKVTIFWLAYFYRYIVWCSVTSNDVMVTM